MATIVDKVPNNCVQMTQIQMTGSDLNFTFSARVRTAQIQASAATSSMYLAATSSSHAPWVLPNGQSSSPLELQAQGIAGMAVTFNGTNNQFVSIIEYLYAST